jgi:hypothetical protein
VWAAPVRARPGRARVTRSVSGREFLDPFSEFDEHVGDRVEQLGPLEACARRQSRLRKMSAHEVHDLGRVLHGWVTKELRDRFEHRGCIEEIVTGVGQGAKDTRAVNFDGLRVACPHDALAKRARRQNKCDEGARPPPTARTTWWTRRFGACGVIALGMVGCGRMCSTCPSRWGELTDRVVRISAPEQSVRGVAGSPFAEAGCRE